MKMFRLDVWIDKGEIGRSDIPGILETINMHLHEKEITFCVPYVFDTPKHTIHFNLNDCE